MKKENLISIRKKMLRQAAFSLVVMTVLPLTALNAPADTKARSKAEASDADGLDGIDWPQRHCTRLKT